MGKNYARVEHLNQVMAESVAPCGYIDSLKLEKPGEWATYDGQHHDPAGYVAWGKRLTVEIDKSPIVQSLIKKPQ